MNEFDLPLDWRRFGASIQPAIASAVDAHAWYRDHHQRQAACRDPVEWEIRLQSWRSRAGDGPTPEIQRRVVRAHEAPEQPLPPDPELLGALYRTLTPSEGWPHFLWVAFGPAVALEALLQASRARWRSGLLTWSDGGAILHEDTLRLLVDGASEHTREGLRREAAAHRAGAPTQLRLGLLRVFRTPAWLDEELGRLPSEDPRRAGELACLVHDPALARRLLEPALAAGHGFALHAMSYLGANLDTALAPHNLSEPCPPTCT